HQPRVAVEALRGGDVLDPVLLPEPAGVAKGAHSALRADAGAGEDEDAVRRPYAERRELPAGGDPGQRHHGGARELRDARPQARIICAMAVAALRRELSRRMYVRSRMARTAAVRMAYLAYSRALLRWDDRSTPEAAASLRRRLEELFDEDFRDAEEGYYPRSLIDTIPWREYAQAVPRLLADLPRTRARIGRGDFRELPDGAADRYPRYYTRNFHYQSEGYLGHTSAALYDLQVELLFGGTADAMRRRLIAPVVRAARART